MLATDRVAFDILDTWQGRTLSAAKGQTQMVLLSALAHTFDSAMLVLVPLAIPSFTGQLEAPHLTTAAKIDINGAVVADVVDRFGVIKETMIYPSEAAMREDFMRLADHLKLIDTDRVELFKCVQRWVVSDRRLDPKFAPKDPDAKLRLN